MNLGLLVDDGALRVDIC